MSDPGESTFEQAERELAEIVARLERGEVGLDEAIALWQQGEALYARCVALLDAAEGRIEEMTVADEPPVAPE
jgi:exodeoxyribonuclease VII small subunit